MNEELESMLGVIYDNLPVGVLVVSKDDEERILYHNKQMLEIMQCESDEDFHRVSQDCFSGLYHDEGKESIRHIIRSRHHTDSSNIFISFMTQTGLGHMRRLECVLNHENERSGNYWVLSVISSSDRNDQMAFSKVSELMTVSEFYQAALKMADKAKKEGNFETNVPLYFNLTNFHRYNEIYGTDKGDRLLNEVAYIIIEEMPEAIIAHHSADNFIALASRERLVERIENICHRVNEYIGESDIVMKVGLRPYEEVVSKQQTKRAFDEARIACVSIEHNSQKMWAVYNSDIAKREELKHYILTHFEEALKNHDIDVYFQPIVRTLSGKICEVEALARWQDERYGMIMPNVFIPVLEESALITKLDTFIVELTAEILDRHLRNHERIVPVSFNFSHTDFGIMDLIDFLDSCVERYHIPRNYLRVEINEKGLQDESAVLTNSIEKLSQKSYRVSMDDFGKGYASLQLLKKYSFDEIKLDISFMTDFDDNTQKILQSLVSLAKSMNIHALAKGVETSKQKEFLEAIGCEKMQGYLYAQPMKAEALKAFSEEHQIQIETPLEAQLFDRAGLVSLTGRSTGIYQLYNGELQLLAMNKVYKGALEKAGIKNVEESKHLKDKYNRDMIQFFVEAQTREGAIKNTFLINGVLLLLEVEKIAGPKDNGIFVAHLYDMVYQNDALVNYDTMIDDFLHASAQIYDGAYKFNYKKDECYVIKSSNSLVQKAIEGYGIEDAIRNIAKTLIYKEDRERFLKFMQKDYILDKVKRSNKNQVIEYIRSRDLDGSYQWRICVLVVNENEQAITLFVIEDFWHRLENRGEIRHLYNDFYHFDDTSDDEKRHLKADLFDDMIANSRDPIYWKDKDLRYRGANLEFLRMHGINSFHEILGKTDAEIGWRFNERKASKLEREVMKSGVAHYDVPDQINANHRLCRIVETKIPYFSNGKVLGLISIITDQDTERKLQVHEGIHIIDEETNMQTYRDMIGTLEQCDGYYRMEGVDYTAVMMEVADFRTYAKDYGDEIRAKMLKRIVEILKEAFPRETFYARVSECSFLFVTKGNDLSNLRERLISAGQKIHAISDIDGCTMTLYLDYAITCGSEVYGVDQLLTRLMERMSNNRENRLGEAVYIGDRIIFNLNQFENMSERVTIIDPDTYDIVYINKMYLQDLHLPANYHYLGQKCYQLFRNRDTPCELCNNSQLSRDRFISSTIRNLVSNTDYIRQSTLIPWKGKNYRFTLNINMGEYLQIDEENKRMLYNEVNANDAIRLAIEETDPQIGIQKIISHIAKSLEAERFFIFEENENGTVSCTYEWESDPDVSLKERYQNVPYSAVEHLYKQFEKNELVLIPNAGKYLLDHPGVHFKMKGIKRAVCGYLKNSEKSYGFTEVINPSPATFKTASELLSILTWFITLLLRNRDNMREMQKLTNEDQLTGVLNRRGFEEAIVNIPDGTYILAIFVDINGLKRVNDTQGHKAGDGLIVRAANVMIDLFDSHHVFRMGGDEFLLYKEIENDEEALEYVTKLKEASQNNDVSLAIGYTMIKAPITDVNAFIHVIDERMYEDKGRHYHRRSTDR